MVFSSKWSLYGFYLHLRKTLWNYDLRLRYTDSETIEIKYNRITEKQWRDYEVKQEKPKQNCLKKFKNKAKQTCTTYNTVRIEKRK